MAFNLDRIERLLKNYESQRNILLRSDSDFSEADTRANFIDLFFAALGWDINNERGTSQRFREVIRETQVSVEEHTKKPDYAFRLGPERRFFTEAKRPNTNIREDKSAAFQVRRYGWSAGLLISVLTNFENLIIYDTTTQPSAEHAANNSRLHVFSYNDYIERINEIADLISRDSVYSGDFDARFSKQTRQRDSESIDAVFLQTLNGWRTTLGADLSSRHPEIDVHFLNEIIQRFILRILFLRMCEDRGIQTYEHLKTVARTNDWGTFLNMLRESDIMFDSELFGIRNDPFFNTKNNVLRLDGNIVKDIIEALYFPNAPYTFSVFKPEFLGEVYEQFLTHRIEVKHGNVVLEEKPENEDRDVVHTPRPIIERVVHETLETRINDKSPEELLDLKIIDPACGSGGFLISAFDILIDRAISSYLEQDDYEAVYETSSGKHLAFEKKCNLLTSCLYGVDRDILAVEVTRFSLLVKLLEDETLESLPDRKKLLPPLENNVACGDSLVDERIYSDDPDPEMVGVPLTWGQDIIVPFSIVISNPPYLFTEAMVNLEPVEYAFYQHYYTSAFRQFDKYYLFIEKSIRDLMAENGQFGMVVSRKFTHIESGKKLRGLISGGRHLIRIIDFGTAQMFRGRTTYTCLLFLSKAGAPIPENDDDDTVDYEMVNTPEDWLLGRVGDHSKRIELPRRFVSGESAWLLPSTQTELDLIIALNEDTIPLGQIFDVFNGIQTSRNSVYVLTEWRDVDDKLIAFTKEGQEWFIERNILKHFFDDGYGDLVSFHPMPDTARIIFPYSIEAQDNEETRAIVIPSDMMKRDFPHAYTWLEHNIDTLKDRDISPEPYPMDEWYRYGRDQALTSFKNRPKIVVGVNSLGDKYVYDETSSLLASGGTAGECAIAHFRAHEEQGSYDLHFILAILNHKAIEFFCRKRGSPFRGGWFARGTAVLKDVPVPLIRFDDQENDKKRIQMYNMITIASKDLCNIYRKLSSRTSTLEQLRLKRRARTLRRRMNHNISNLYNISRITDKVDLPT